MKINHKDSYIDFGEQFEVDNKIDGFHGSKEMLEDVREMWTDGIPNFDIYKNINVLKNLCNKNNISFIDGLSILENERKKTNKKIYNYPAGNLSGHLEPEGELAIANSLVKFINENKILE